MESLPLVPTEILEILNRAPVKLELIDGHKYVDSNHLRTIKSPNIFAPNSSKFHPEGLFSEEIFGNITDMNRFVTEAAIPLNTSIIHPTIFAMNIQPKALYTNILSSRQYAVFDNETNNFVLSTSDNPDAGTGFQFFLSHIDKLADVESSSLRAMNKAKLISKYKDRLTITHFICIPAGLRDLDMKSSRLSSDDLNKLYMAVINLTTSLAGFRLSNDAIFDGIRYQIQLKVAAVFDYILNLISGKGGFTQKHFGARKIAFSTRNVISAATNSADYVDSPSVIKSDETMMPMLNLIKCYQPFFVHYVKNKLYGEIFKQGSSEKVAVTNPDTLEIEYATLKPVEVNRYTTSEGVTRIINQFRYVGFRESPISVKNVDGKEFWLLIVYDIADQVFLAKNSTDLQRIVESFKLEYDRTKVRPMTWVEFLYIAGLHISKGKHGSNTRYPVLEDGSIYYSATHIITTNPSKEATVIFDSGLTIEAPHYPILSTNYHESIILHQSRLEGLSADHDGDQISATALWMNESNDDVKGYLNSIASVISPDMRLKLSTNSDILNLTIHNLSRQDIIE